MITLLQLSPYTGDMVSPSPNHDARQAQAIEGIVLHATADEGEEAPSLSWLRSPKSRVSCHLLVSRAGRVTRLVGDRQRAWHAGVAWWRGTSDVNSITLGIEIANRNDGEPYTDAQYSRVAAIVAHYCGQGLSLDDVVSHGEIAQRRRRDPLGWNWDRFRGMVQNQLWPAVVPPPLVPALPTPAPAGAVASAVPGVPSPAQVPGRVAPPKQQGAPAPRPKPVIHSRTLWLNMVTVMCAGGLLVSDALDLAHRVGIQLPEDVIKWALFLVGVVNIILRFRTSRPLTCGQNVPGSPAEPGLMARADEPRATKKEERRQRARGAAAVPVR